MTLSAQEKQQNELDVLWVTQQLIGPFAAFNHSYVGWAIVEDSEEGRKATTELKNQEGQVVWMVKVVADYVRLLALWPNMQYQLGDRYILRARNREGTFCTFAAADKEYVEFYGAQPVEQREWLLAVRDVLAAPVSPPTPKHAKVLDDYMAYATFLAEGVCADV